MSLLHADHMPTVKAVMTPFPHSVQLSDPVERAREIMREHEVRHVPVQDGEKLVGIVSDRDLGAQVNRALPTSDRARIPVRSVCVTDDLYSVDLNTPLDHVLTAMAARHVGSVIVTRKGRLAGIFTTTDACRALAELLRARFEGGPDEVA